MRPADVVALVKDTLAQQAQSSYKKCKEIDNLLSPSWDEWSDLERPEGDRGSESKRLRKLAHTPVLRLIVEETAQHMVATGITSDSGRDTGPMWAAMERNGFPSRQGALYSAALAYGQAHALVLPGTSPVLDGPAAALSFFSPKHLHVVWGDVAEDEWPLYALRTISQPSGRAWRFIDEEAVHFLAEDRGRLEYIERRPHGLGCVPVVRFAPNADIDGESDGEPERFKIPAMRHEKTTHDRLMAQHFNSWRVRTATGLEDPGTPEEASRQKALLSNGDILTGGEGVVFGTLPETSLDGLLRAEQEDLTSLAAVAQKPVWALSGGQLVNLSADAIAEARSSARLKMQAFRRSLGQSLARTVRLTSWVEQRLDDARDFGLHVTWDDDEARSLSQAADALAKIAEGLGVPGSLLWDMIPGVTPVKADEWRRWVEEHPDVDEVLMTHLAQAAADGADQ